MPQAGDCEVRCKAGQASPDDRGQEELQPSVGDGLDSIDNAMRLPAHAQRRRRRERSYQQIHEAARPEPDPRHNSQRGGLGR